LSYITQKDKEYQIICPGGGFGPVDPNGYGVSYTIMGDSLLNFHVSSQHSAETTNSKRFALNIGRAMEMIGAFLEQAVKK
jgi:carnitine O-palmitoyltransferase 1